MNNLNGKSRLFPCLFIGFSLFLFGCTATGQSSKKDTEAINIGYGETTPNNVTGAVATVRTGDASIQSRESVADILRGRIAGVEVWEEPGGGLRVRVRNASSLIAGSSPLYVVDGFPLSTPNGVLYDINPYDIQSITVLKDAASTAIYGSRGANGVVLITTK